MKKAISVIMSIIMTFTFVCGTISTEAEEAVSQQPNVQIENDALAVKGTDSFSNMLSDEISKGMDKLEENEHGVIFSAEVTGNIVTVKYSASKDCTLLAAVYTEDGKDMLGSGKTEVSAEENLAEITVYETGNAAMSPLDFPEYFYLRVFMIDTETLRPLCSVYESPNYTREMQEFFATTVEDFTADRVYNLDADPTNNFVVFSDDVKIIPHGDNVNNVTTADEEKEIYVIENADETVMSLQAGDIFTYIYDEGQILIAQVDTISVEDTTVSITGRDTDFEDAFEYIKIDTEKGSIGQQNVTPIINEPNANYLPSNSYMSPIASFSPTISDSDIPLDDKGIFLDYQLTFTVKYYKADISRYFEFSIDYEFCVKLPLLKYEKERTIPFKLPSFPRKEDSLIKGLVFVEFEPSLVIKISAESAVKMKVNGILGCKYQKGKGLENISTRPNVSTRVEASVELYVGMDFKPSICVLSKKLLSISPIFSFGIEIGAAAYSEADLTAYRRHSCIGCIEGSIYVIPNITFEVKILNIFKYSTKPLNVKFKFKDFYYSIDHKEFGWDSCPYVEYKVYIKVKDTDNKPVSGAYVNVDNENIGQTNAKGALEHWFKEGDYTFEAYHNKGKKGKKENINVNGSKIVNIILNTDKDEEPKDPSKDLEADYPIHIEKGDVVIDNVVYRPADPNNIYYYYTYCYIGKPINVTIQGSINGYPVLLDNDREITGSCTQTVTMLSGITEIPDRYFSYRTSLKSVIIPDSVTSIGETAFSNCENLTDIRLSNSLKSIGESAFWNCKNLTDIRLPNSLTSIGSSAFSDCKSLKSIIIPDSVTSIGSFTFGFCENLTDIRLSNSLTSIGERTFLMCYALKSIIIPDSVTSIGEGAFMECTGITDIILSDNLTSLDENTFYLCEALKSMIIPDGVTEIPNCTFCGCNNLTSVKLPDSITSIGVEAFSSCYKLTDIKLPKNLKSIGIQAFSCCGALKSIVIPDNVTEIFDGTFSGCVNLSDITFSKNLTSFDDSFEDCYSLKNINVPSENKKYSSIDGVLFNKEQTELIRYPCEKDWEIYTVPNKTKIIKSKAFMLAQNLTALKLPVSVSCIEKDALIYCYCLLCHYLDVYYQGTEQQWNQIKIAKDFLSEVTVHYGYTDLRTVNDMNYEYTNDVIYMSEEPEYEYEPELETGPESEPKSVSEPVSEPESIFEPEGNFIVDSCFPNDICIIYIMERSETGDILTTDNLFYIGQSVADSNGIVVFDVEFEKYYYNYDYLVRSMSGFDISEVVTNAEVSVISKDDNTDKLYCDGEENFVDADIWIGGKQLRESVDYELDGDFVYTRSGKHELIVKGIGKYSGSMTLPYNVKCDHVMSGGKCTICGFPYEDSEIMVGDISGNGKIDLYDAIEIAKSLVGKRTFTEEELEFADFNGDGKVDLYDAIGIAKYLVSV